MLNYPIKVDKETKELLKRFLRELKDLNENLLDFKKMIAPYLGFRVTKDKGR